MPKLTKEQLEKWNAAAKNGFRFDVQYFLTWNEKELIKYILLDAAGLHMMQYKLLYMPEYEKKSNNYCSWNVKTGRQIPALHVSEWYRPDRDALWRSSGTGKYIHIGPAQKTKSYKILCDFSGAINLDALPPYNEITAGTCPAGLLAK